MMPLPVRLALQVALVFCLIAATLGLGADLGGPTILMRAVVCALAGAGIGAGSGGLIVWLRRIAADIPELPGSPSTEPLAVAPAAEAPALSEGQAGG